MKLYGFQQHNQPSKRKLLLSQEELISLVQQFKLLFDNDITSVPPLFTCDKEIFEHEKELKHGGVTYTLVNYVPFAYGRTQIHDDSIFLLVDDNQEYVSPKFIDVPQHIVLEVFLSLLYDRGILKTLNPVLTFDPPRTSKLSSFKNLKLLTDDKFLSVFAEEVVGMCKQNGLSTDTYIQELTSGPDSIAKFSVIRTTTGRMIKLLQSNISCYICGQVIASQEENACPCGVCMNCATNAKQLDEDARCSKCTKPLNVKVLPPTTLQLTATTSPLDDFIKYLTLYGNQQLSLENVVRVYIAFEDARKRIVHS